MMSLKKFFYFVYFEGKRQIFILLTPDFGRKTLFFEREQSKNQSQNARTPDFLNNFFFILSLYVDYGIDKEVVGNL